MLQLLSARSALRAFPRGSARRRRYYYHHHHHRYLWVFIVITTVTYITIMIIIIGMIIIIIIIMCMISTITIARRRRLAGPRAKPRRGPMEDKVCGNGGSKERERERERERDSRSGGRGWRHWTRSTWPGRTEPPAAAARPSATIAKFGGAACLTLLVERRCSSNVINYGDPWHDQARIKQTRPH